jgi:hypothetical protein
VLSVKTGRRLRENVFETGGSRSTLDSFKAFRGREPRIDALLRHQGLSAPLLVRAARYSRFRHAPARAGAPMTSTRLPPTWARRAGHRCWG